MRICSVRVFHSSSNANQNLNSLFLLALLVVLLNTDLGNFDNLASLALFDFNLRSLHNITSLGLLDFDNFLDHFRDGNVGGSFNGFGSFALLDFLRLFRPLGDSYGALVTAMVALFFFGLT